MNYVVCNGNLVHGTVTPTSYYQQNVTANHTKVTFVMPSAPSFVLDHAKFSITLTLGTTDYTIDFNAGSLSVLSGPYDAYRSGDVFEIDAATNPSAIKSYKYYA
jgi:hypothetical protein